MNKISIFGFLFIIASITFVLESPNIQTSFGAIPNPNCSLAVKGANLQGLDLSNCNLSGKDLTGTNFASSNLTSTNLTGAKLAGDNIHNAILKNTILTSANLTNADLSSDNLQGASLVGAILSGANFHQTNLVGDNLQGAILVGTIFSSADLTNANLANTNLSNDNLHQAILVGTILTGANLTKADLSSDNLQGASLVGAIFSGANLHQATLIGDNLQGAVFKGTDLSSADLTTANLSGDNFQGANLQNTILVKANLAGANLQGDTMASANLSGANLSNANLSGANLQNANLSGANIATANLTGANLNGANLTGAITSNPSRTSTEVGTVKITDQITKLLTPGQVKVNYKNSESDTVKITDQLATSVTIGKVILKGTITIQTSESALVPGSTYTITPNPKTGLGSITITDGGVGDEDGTNDGTIKITQVPQDQYEIDQVSIPAGFSSLLLSTTITINEATLDQSVTFQVIPINTDLTTLPSTPITSPSLNNDTFTQWTKTFSATIVSNGTSSNISSADQTPQVIVAGTQNTTEIEAAINAVSSVVLDTTFPPLTTGSTIIDTMGLENYTLPNSTNVVSVIPTILAQVNDTTDYVVATPPFSEIIPGQQMIIPIADSLLPSFGGLKQIDVQSSPTAQPVGESNTEWLVAEVDNKIPSSINVTGIASTPVLFLNIQHPFEESGSGFNWSDPANHEVPPLLTLVINKETNDIQQDSEGCPVVVAYTLIIDTWTTSGVTEVGSKSISPTQCEITIQSEHLSKFAFSLQHLSTLIVRHSSDDARGKSPLLKPAEAFAGTLSPETTTSTPPVKTDESPPVVQTPTFQIPLWVKDNAKSWHEGKLDNSNFALGVKYMIQQKIIKIQESPNKTPVGATPDVTIQKIPSWVKNNANWWSNGEISDYEYVNAIQWLVSNHIIKMS